MGEVRRKHGIEEKWIQNFSRKISNEEITRIYGRIILKIDVKEFGYNDEDYIHLGEDRDPYHAPITTVTNLRILYNAENFLSR
jgi:hypothetical protein